MLKKKWVLIEWQVKRFMLTRNDVQRDLLQKFSELCMKANVNYVLHAHAAFLAYANQPINQINSLEVLMCQGDAEKVSGLLDDEAYYFEDSRSNPKFTGSYMMFGLKNSLDLKTKDLNFDTSRNIDNHCIRIIIHFIERPKRRISGKILGINNKLLKFRYMDDDFNFRDYKSKRKFANNVFKVVNDGFYNNRMHGFKKRTISIDTWQDIKKYPLVQITGKAPFKSSLLDSVLPVDFDGVDSYIVGDFEEYAKNLYGVDWPVKKWASVNECSSAMISWEEYSNDPEVKRSLDEIQKRFDIIQCNYVKTEDSRKEILEMKEQIRQSKRVIYVREDCIQQKDKIMDLYRLKDTKNLEILLDPLIEALTIGIDRGYTFSVDEDIDNVVDSYLRENNYSDLADDIKEYRMEV